MSEATTKVLMLTAVLKCSESTLRRWSMQKLNQCRNENFSILDILYGYRWMERLLETGRKQEKSNSAVIE